MSKSEPDLPDEAEDQIDQRYIVPGLSRGLALLQLFDAEHSEQKLTEIARGMGLSRSATYRLVYTLEKDGFIRRDASSQRYSLTAKVLSLGFSYLNNMPMTDTARPFLQRLGEAARATTYLVTLDGWEIVNLCRFAPTAALISNIQIGERHPAHQVASGRMIMAHLAPEQLREVYKGLKKHCEGPAAPGTFATIKAICEEDRARGYVLTPSPHEKAIIGCASVVRDRSGVPVAAIAVAGPQSFVTDFGGEAQLARTIIDVTTEFSRELGFKG